MFKTFFKYLREKIFFVKYFIFVFVNVGNGRQGHITEGVGGGQGVRPRYPSQPTPSVPYLPSLILDASNQ